MKKQASPELASRCEDAFQKGRGKAQVRHGVSYSIGRNCERVSEALRYANDDEMVLHRAKGRNGKYTWFIAKEPTK